MANAYKINVVNQSSSTQFFWCFLDKPKLQAGPQVFANSSASLAVRANSQGRDSFYIPLQYSVEAGAASQAVGLNVKVNSSVGKAAAPGDVLRADYHSAPPKRGPDLSKTAGSAGKNIVVETSQYDKAGNHANKWYENLSFGIDSPGGFMGVTWSPDPGTSYTITPDPAFYISTRQYQAYQLADIDFIARESAHVTLKDFSPQNEVWVILDSRGRWAVTSSEPRRLQGSNEPAAQDQDPDMERHLARYLDQDWAQDVARHDRAGDNDLSLLRPPLPAPDLATKITGVQWLQRAASGHDPHVTPSSVHAMIQVADRPGFTANALVVAGLAFSVNKLFGGALVCVYHGPLSPQTLRSTVVAGANAIVKGWM